MRVKTDMQKANFVLPLFIKAATGRCCSHLGWVFPRQITWSRQFLMGILCFLPVSWFQIMSCWQLRFTITCGIFEYGSYTPKALFFLLSMAWGVSAIRRKRPLHFSGLSEGTGRTGRELSCLQKVRRSRGCPVHLYTSLPASPALDCAWSSVMIRVS